MRHQAVAGRQNRLVHKNDSWWQKRHHEIDVCVTGGSFFFTELIADAETEGKFILTVVQEPRDVEVVGVLPHGVPAWDDSSNSANGHDKPKLRLIEFVLLCHKTGVFAYELFPSDFDANDSLSDPGDRLLELIGPDKHKYLALAASTDSNFNRRWYSAFPSMDRALRHFWAAEKQPAPPCPVLRRLITFDIHHRAKPGSGHSDLTNDQMYVNAPNGSGGAPGPDGGRHRSDSNGSIPPAVKAEEAGLKEYDLPPLSSTCRCLFCAERRYDDIVNLEVPPKFSLAELRRLREDASALSGPGDWFESMVTSCLDRRILTHSTHSWFLLIDTLSDPVVVSKNNLFKAIADSQRGVLPNTDMGDDIAPGTSQPISFNSIGQDMLVTRLSITDLKIGCRNQIDLEPIQETYELSVAQSTKKVPKGGHVPFEYVNVMFNQNEVHQGQVPYDTVMNHLAMDSNAGGTTGYLDIDEHSLTESNDAIVGCDGVAGGENIQLPRRAADSPQLSRSAPNVIRPPVSPYVNGNVTLESARGSGDTDTDVRNLVVEDTAPIHLGSRRTVPAINGPTTIDLDESDQRICAYTNLQGAKCLGIVVRGNFCARHLCIFCHRPKSSTQKTCDDCSSHA